MSVIQHPYEFKLVQAKRITVNRLYQRDEKKPQVWQIINHFDYHLVNPVKVVFRDGHYFAFDGQQTTTALRAKFGDDYLVPCLVYYDVPSWVDEAVLFEGTNGKNARKAVSIGDLWKSRLARGEEAATDIKAILERYGMELVLTGKTNNGVAGRVQALHAVDSIYRKYGSAVFDETMHILALVWHGEVYSISAPMVYGMGLFVKTYYGEYERNRLVSKLSKTYASTIITAGKASSAPGHTKYAREILNIYNSYASPKSRLPDKL